MDLCPKSPRLVIIIDFFEARNLLFIVFDEE
jgi:hypothetical protein